MAIIHVVLNSSSSAPLSAAHSDYITRHGYYAKMGAAVYVESGNMPDFAQDSPQHFWEAADVQERQNGRTYTELQIALPRELSEAQRIELARAATREFLGPRFAYTLAIHNPEAADKIEQPHLHLMWSERAIDDTTRAIPEEKFFKRNGAKKDRKWNDQNLADELRGKWAEMMNRALENAGIDQRVDPRSLADQGKVAEALLVEPKMLRRGTPEEKEARRQEIAEIREAKAVLSKIEIAAPDIESVRKADQASQQKLEATVEQIETWEAQELSKLDRLIEAVKNMARATAAKVKEILSPRPAEISGAGNPQFQAAMDWFNEHGYSKLLAGDRYKNRPEIVLLDAQAEAKAARSIDEAQRWKEHGQILCDHFAAINLKQLREKYPNETENRLRIAAEGRALKVPLGKGQEEVAEKQVAAALAAQKLKSAEKWFNEHGYSKLLAGDRYKNRPEIVLLDAQAEAKAARSIDEAQRWKEHGAELHKHFEGLLRQRMPEREAPNRSSRGKEKSHGGQER